MVVSVAVVQRSPVIAVMALPMLSSVYVHLFFEIHSADFVAVYSAFLQILAI